MCAQNVNYYLEVLCSLIHCTYLLWQLDWRRLLGLRLGLRQTTSRWDKVPLQVVRRVKTSCTLELVVHGVRIEGLEVSYPITMILELVPLD